MLDCTPDKIWLEPDLRFFANSGAYLIWNGMRKNGHRIAEGWTYAGDQTRTRIQRSLAPNQHSYNLALIQTGVEFKNKIKPHLILEPTHNGWRLKTR